MCEAYLTCALGFDFECPLKLATLVAACCLTAFWSATTTDVNCNDALLTSSFVSALVFFLRLRFRLRLPIDSALEPFSCESIKSKDVSVPSKMPLIMLADDDVGSERRATPVGTLNSVLTVASCSGTVSVTLIAPLLVAAPFGYTLQNRPTINCYIIQND